MEAEVINEEAVAEELTIESRLTPAHEVLMQQQSVLVELLGALNDEYEQLPEKVRAAFDSLGQGLMLPERLVDHLIYGVRRAGNYEPSQVLWSVEDVLTENEYELLYSFLCWACNGKIAFSSANIQQTYAAYVRATSL